MNIHVPEHTSIQMWFTAQELADAALAGIINGVPTTKRRVNEMVDRENWQRYTALVKTETGRGGTITRYHIELLPLHVRIAYFTRFIKVEPLDCIQLLPGAEFLTDRARLSRDARLSIVRMADRFRRMSDLNAVTADCLFVEIYNASQIDVPEWVRGTVGKLSSRSLMRWRTKGRDEGSEALAHDPALARKGSGLLATANDGEVSAFIIAWIASNPALAAEEIMDYVEDEFGAELVDRSGEFKPLPPLRTFQHFIKGVKSDEKVVLTSITNPDKFRSTMKLRGTGSYSWVTRPNQLWMIDASPGDALLLDGRHSIYVCIDVATRWITATVSKTARASAVGLMMRKAILKNGVCRGVKTDNGSDFVAQETVRLMDALDIEVQLSQKYTPEEKAFVERAIKTIQHKFFVQLPGYIGHNVTERKAIEERKSFANRLGQGQIETFSVSLTAQDLQTKLDDWLEHKYHQRKHGGLGMQTPAAVMAASATAIRRVDERALDVLLMPVARNNGICKMTPQGIKIDGHHYLCGTIMPGTEVFVRLSPDMGKVLVFSVEDGRFLDEAICPKLSDINRAAFTKATKDQFNEIVSSRAREIKADARKLLKGPSGIDRTIRLAKRKTAEREAASANVIQLPRREEQHSTPQIAAALDAMTASDRPFVSKLSAAAAELHAAIERDLAPPAATDNVTPIRTDATPAQRFRAALSIEQRALAREAVDPEETLWLLSYKDSAEYKTQKAMWEDFGDQAPGLRT